ncbi:MAG: MarR family transcriptional regulator [Saprospiraceae bacterium]|nr:MarR family transcriptional regulator [Saprospiraceae bacterium]
MILEEAIKQTKFSSTELRTVLNLYHTHSSLQTFSHSILRPFSISIQQFNILRILRGQNGSAVSVSEITCRMLDKMSNTSRLIEKLRQKELIIRNECPEDRRRAEIEITPKGLQLIQEASEKMDSEIIKKMQVLSDDEIDTLNIILDKLNLDSN